MDAKKIEELREVFLLFDKDDDGKITAEEIGLVMKSFGKNPTDIELQDIVNEVDENSNGVIDFCEFIQIMTKIEQDSIEDSELYEAFMMFDLDKNGIMDKHELSYLMENIGENLSEYEIDRIFRSVDEDNSGGLDFQGKFHQ